MQENVFITGTSTGLGNGFAKCYLEEGWQVFGVSRRDPNDLLENPKFHFQSLDLERLDEIPEVLEKLFQGVERISIVILNAGILGKIGDMTDQKVNDLKQIMDVNLWGNKIILDCLLRKPFEIDQIISISSGAAVNGNRGWGGYSLSKAALNMLTQLYAREFSEVHFTALAPGLIDTAMQDYLCEFADETRFPSVKKLKAARNTPSMPKPKEAAQNIRRCFPRLLNYESGSFVDIRTIDPG